MFDKYGLKGCGGADGPYESLRVFARAHEVDLQRLIQELEESNSSVNESSSDQIAPALGDVIYRRFFLAAVAFLLTVGASWGAAILWSIGSSGTFQTASVFDIQAHAQAQVFGWMGLVIMGFAYQAFPRFWHTELRNATRANLSFWAMVGGVVASMIGIYAAQWAPFALPLTILGGCLEVFAVSLFALELYCTYQYSRKQFEPYMAYVFISVFWFLIGTILNGIHSAALVSSVHYLPMTNAAFWLQTPMRDVQFHGLGMTIIIGVSLRTLPHIFGVKQPSRAFAWWALVALTAAVVVETVLSLTGKYPHWSVSLVLLTVAATAVCSFRLWQKFPDGDRSEKFIKAGWIWVLISLVMMVAASVNFQLTGLPATHAYMGSIRHAITVGFISLMIMGYAAKVVATLNGLDTHKLTSLAIPFVLVNLGCAIRVIGQSLTDAYPGAFPVAGVSGTLEACGMAIWGLHITRIILTGKFHSAAPRPAGPSPEKVAVDMIVADVLTWFPETESVFVEFGFRPVTNPFMRRTVARQVTLRQACQLHNIEPEDFVAILNESLRGTGCSGKCNSGQCEAQAMHGHHD